MRGGWRQKSGKRDAGIRQRSPASAEHVHQRQSDVRNWQRARHRCRFRRGASGGRMVFAAGSIASQENAAISARVTEQSAPIPAPLALVRAKPGTDDDDATLPDQRTVNVTDADRAPVTEGHSETDVSQAAAGAGLRLSQQTPRALTEQRRTRRRVPKLPRTGAPSRAWRKLTKRCFADSCDGRLRASGAQAALPPAERINNPKVHLVRLAPTVRHRRRRDRTGGPIGRFRLQAGSPPGRRRRAFGSIRGVLFATQG